MSGVAIRDERGTDADAIRAMIAAAFAAMPFSHGTEAAIIAALRAAGGLSVSLVAAEGNAVFGHVAFSPVAIDGASGWYGLGPLAVRPDRQRRGIGSALVRTGLDRLARAGAKGCVVLGDPGYYARFGFAAHPGLVLPGVQAEYFQALALDGPVPAGTVAFHPAFAAGD